MDRANEKSNGCSKSVEDGQSISTKRTPQCGVDVKTRRPCQYCLLDLGVYSLILPYFLLMTPLRIH